jgi:hypothetical protein
MYLKKKDLHHVGAPKSNTILRFRSTVCVWPTSNNFCTSGEIFSGASDFGPIGWMGEMCSGSKMLLGTPMSARRLKPCGRFCESVSAETFWKNF